MYREGGKISKGVFASPNTEDDAEEGEVGEGDRCCGAGEGDENEGEEEEDDDDEGEVKADEEEAEAEGGEEDEKKG